MEIRTEHQQHAVSDEVSAITAVVRPIITGIVFPLKVIGSMPVSTLAPFGVGITGDGLKAAVAHVRA